MPLEVASGERKVLVVPEDVKAQFHQEMRSHMAGFDEILSAIAEGDFRGAARIAENGMIFGPNIWVVMADRGMSPEKNFRNTKTVPKIGCGRTEKNDRENGRARKGDQARIV